MPARPRPLIGVLCCNEVAERPVQVVASRFIEPLSRLSDATVLLVPAVAHATDVATLADLFDGLLLTGSRSHVAPERYGRCSRASSDRLDTERDEVALSLAGRMIEAGKPVFGICRGLQEINVLFGGTLSGDRCGGRHHRSAAEDGYAEQFEHCHEVELTHGGRLASARGGWRSTRSTSRRSIAWDRVWRSRRCLSTTASSRRSRRGRAGRMCWRFSGTPNGMSRTPPPARPSFA